MNSEFTNRLGMFRTTVDYLLRPDNNPKWNGQPPARFGARTAEAASAVSALADFCQQQGSPTTGSAADKAREEAELEDAAFVLGQAVGECCRALGHEADTAKCAFPISDWRRMRNETLLASAREVIRIAEGLIAGPHTAAALDCGVSAGRVAQCKKEADDYQGVITAPQQATAGRKGLTTQMRDRFNAVEAIFISLDGLIDQFSDKNFVEGYKAARTVRDLGHGPGAPPPATPAPMTTPPSS